MTTDTYGHILLCALYYCNLCQLLDQEIIPVKKYAIVAIIITMIIYILIPQKDSFLLNKANILKFMHNNEIHNSEHGSSLRDIYLICIFNSWRVIKKRYG